MDFLGQKLLKSSIFNLQKRSYHHKKVILILHLFFVQFGWIDYKTHNFTELWFVEFQYTRQFCAKNGQRFRFQKYTSPHLSENKSNMFHITFCCCQVFLFVSRLNFELQISKLIDKCDELIMLSVTYILEFLFYRT